LSSGPNSNHNNNNHLDNNSSSNDNNNNAKNNVKNELVDFFDNLNNFSSQQSITKRNDTYTEPKKTSPTSTTAINTLFIKQNLSDNYLSATRPGQNIINSSSNANANILPTGSSPLKDNNFSANHNQDNVIIYYLLFIIYHNYNH